MVAASIAVSIAIRSAPKRSCGVDAHRASVSPSMRPPNGSVGTGPFPHTVAMSYSGVSPDQMAQCRTDAAFRIDVLTLRAARGKRLKERIAAVSSPT